MEIKIEKGIPIDLRSFGRKRNPILEALFKLEIGESFFVVGKRSLVAQRIVYAQKKTGKKYSTRRQEDGYRVWRIA